MSITQQSAVGTMWQQLCDCFTRDPGLWAEVDMALHSPAAYLESFDGRLRDRGVTTVEGVSPWLALVDWLYENDRLVELRGENSSEDLYADLSGLPALATGIDLAPIASERVHLGFAVPRANAILAGSLWTLLYLDIGPGSCPLALVSSDTEPRIRQLAAAVGHTARAIDARDVAGPVSRGEHGYTVGLPFNPPPRTGPRPVNFGKRLLALLIDTVVLYGISIGAVALAAALFGNADGFEGTPIAPLILGVLLVYLIGLAVLVGRTGQSLGMMALGLRLVRVDTGAVPGFWAAAGRGALTVALVFGIWFLVVLVTTLSDPNGRGLHDKAAGTLMIDKRRTAAIGS